jgi:cytochrome c oxidase subunit II
MLSTTTATRFAARSAAAISAFFTWLFVAGTAFAEDVLPVIGAPQERGLGFQPAASPVKVELEHFHDLLLIIITAITVFVLGLLVYVAVRFRASANPVPSQTTHHTWLEVAWTVLPVFILVIIAIPSFRILYYMEKAPNPEMTLKVTGHQWYWSYEYPDHGGIAFDSRLIPEEELKPGQLRLLETDNRVVVPVGTDIRVQVTAADVLHAWAVPSFGVKKDAVPGRLNETWFNATREGLFYGQCSEICGTQHGYMPIAIEVVSKERFAKWVEKTKLAQGIIDSAPSQTAASAGGSALAN